jgi:nucleotide-binding universal stress UspA family protein
VQEEREAQFKNEFMARCGNVSARLIFRVGLPYEEILKTITAEGIDLVVMGTKGRTNLSGALFGTTAEKVYRRATCAVMSIRGPEHCRLPDNK